jgi:hypothetical protein
MRSKFYRLVFVTSFPRLAPYVPHHAACSRIGSISENEGQRPTAVFSASADVLCGLVRTSPCFVPVAATICIPRG